MNPQLFACLLLALGGILLAAAPGFVHEFVAMIAVAIAPAALRVIGVLSVAVALLIGYYSHPRTDNHTLQLIGQWHASLGN